MLLNSNCKQDILNGLNEQQKEIVLNYHGPMSVAAAPGSGKTHVLIQRCAYMLTEGIPAKNILLFTFTKKAATEIKERLIKKVGNDAELVTVSTYHSFCAKVLRRYAELIGWNRNFSIFDDDDKNSLLKKIMLQEEIEKSSITLKTINNIISRYKEKMISPIMAQQQASSDFDKRIADIYEIYNNQLKEQNAFDFDDLIYHVIRLLERFPYVLERINNRYKYIMADESQDSSTRDFKLIELLGGEAMNICCIGDADQSIYGFRGVELSSYFNFIQKHKLKQCMLERNYRSTKTIVNAAQSMIVKNVERVDKKSFTNNADGNKIAYVSLDSMSDEANYIVKIVKTMIRHGYEYKDIAVLYRMSYISQIVEKELLKNAIPYTIVGGLPFYNRLEIKDIMAYLRVLSNPKDNTALSRALNTPKRGIGEKSLDKILQTCSDVNCYDIMSLIATLKEVAKALKKKAANGVYNFCAVLEQLNDYINNGAPLNDVISTLLNLTDYKNYLSDTIKDDAEYNDRIGNIEELMNIATQYETLSDFLSNLVEAPTEDNQSTNNNRVQLMTMHASKGLEFPIVIIAEATQGVIPHKKAIENGDIEEERRLFYVAMTRAKEMLFITRSKIVSRGGVAVFDRESQFIKEIPTEYLEVRHGGTKHGYN